MSKETDDDQKYRLIYEQYHRDVYQFMIYFTGDRNTAEDLTQEVFIRVLDAFGRFEGRSSLKTWIMNITRHVAIDYARKKRIRSWMGLDILKLLPSRLGRPEAELEAKEERKQLVEAMMKLKSKYRSVVIFRGLKEYSIKETAEILGCSEAKVRVDFHRAVKELKTHLQAYPEGGWANELSE